MRQLQSDVTAPGPDITLFKTGTMMMIMSIGTGTYKNEKFQIGSTVGGMPVILFRNHYVTITCQAFVDKAMDLILDTLGEEE